MAQRCPECGAPVEEAPWCGACGARLAVRAAAPADVEADGSPSDPGRPWLRRLAVVAVLGVLGSLVVLGGDGELPSPAPPAAGDRATRLVDEVVPPVLPDRTAADRQFAARGTVLWTRSDLGPRPRAQDVTPAGADHVVVEARLLRTGGPVTDDELRLLPAAATTSAFDEDGTWAVAEFGRVVLGGPTPAVTDVVPDGWRPAGPAVAWTDGTPVLRDTDGHLALLAADGTSRWRTGEPVRPDGPVGDRWVAGRRPDGSPVAVHLADGLVVALPAPALALHGDRAVTRPGDVVAVDLRTGAEAWRRTATGATWRALGAGLVAEGPGVAVLVDPVTGAERGRVEGTDVVATDDVVVVGDPEEVEAVTWSGRGRWRLRLAAATVVPVDATRVAVRADPPAGARVTLLDAASGVVLAAAVLPTAVDRALVTSGTAVWVVEAGAPVAVVDRRTGVDVAEESAAAPPPDDDLRFGAGPGAVTVVGGAATLRGTSGGVTQWTVPFGSPLTVAPRRAGTSVLALLADGTVAALDPRTGEVRWRRVLAAVPTAVASDGTMLLVGTDDGQVLRLDPGGRVVTRTVAGSGPVEALAAGRPAAALVGGRLVGIDVDG